MQSSQAATHHFKFVLHTVLIVGISLSVLDAADATHAIKTHQSHGMLIIIL